jgi:hypothetical protein
VGHIEYDEKVLYLHLHMTGGALLFFDQMLENTSLDYDEAVQTLKRRYNSTSRRELHKITFTSREYQTKETFADYLTDLIRLAALAFPDEGFTSRAQERSRRVREAFIHGMPNQMKKVLLGKPESTSVHELCEMAYKKHVIDQLCPSGDYEAEVNEISDGNSNNNNQLVAAVSTLVNSHVELKDTLAALTGQMDKMNRQSRADQPRNSSSYGKNFDNQNREHSGNRGNDGPPRHRGQSGNRNGGQNQNSWVPQNQEQNRNNFSAGNFNQGNNQNFNQGNNQNFNQNGNQGNRIICRICGKPGHKSPDCWFREGAQRNTNIPYKQAPKN